MRKLIRPLAAVVYIACLAVANCVISAGSATAQEQAASPAVKQMVLNKKQIEGVIAAQKEMDEINEKVSEKPKPYLIVAEQLESAAKKTASPATKNTQTSSTTFPSSLRASIR